MFEGVYPPLTTPFRHDEVAYDWLAANIEKFNATGLAGYVLLGSTGEFVLLDEGERDKLLASARERIPSTKRMIAGTGAESTLVTIRQCRRAADLGADAVLVVTPNYYRRAMTLPALRRHYWAVADACPVPVLLYNVPVNTALNMEADQVAALAEHPNIKGIKDSSGNISQAAEIIRQTSKDFELLIGAPLAFLPGLLLGASGGILAIANIAPRECVALYEAARAGQYHQAREIIFRLAPLWTGIGERFGIGGFKASLDLLGFYGGLPRSPLARPSEDGMVEIREILATAGLLA